MVMQWHNVSIQIAKQTIIQEIQGSYSGVKELAENKKGDDIMKLSDNRLNKMNALTKGQLFKHLEIIQKRNFTYCQFDFALPANWVNYVCKQGVDRNLLRKTTKDL